MQYIKLTDDKYIKYDETTDKPEVIFKKSLLVRKAEYEKNIAGLPKITDEFLLEWAKQRQPEIDEIRMKDEFEKKVLEIESDLVEINKL